MSRRRSRKGHARKFDRGSDYAWGPMAQPPPAWSTREPQDIAFSPTIAAFEDLAPPAAATACGKCREFLEGTDWGRGTCLHPASGVLSPWPDTPGCDYYRARR